MRVVFMGTPDFSVPVMTEILAQGHEIVAVYTRAPKPAGRGMDLRPSPAHEADVAVVVAYGLILPKAVLDAPRLGCLNLHASLLPRWRGAAPIQRAIMAGDKETGVMVMKMEEGLDTGPVGMAERVTITPDMTANDLHDRLSMIGADLMVRALAALSRDSLQFTPQAEDGVTYAHKIEKAEARIDWRHPAQEVHDHVRGLSPFPGAFFEVDLGKGPERIKALRSKVVAGQGASGTLLDDALTIACGNGALQLVEVQRAGKAPMKADEFLRGARLAKGAVLPSPA
jgi:methionyl-tRNA formyltransferase